MRAKKQIRPKKYDFRARKEPAEYTHIYTKNVFLKSVHASAQEARRQTTIGPGATKPRKCALKAFYFFSAKTPRNFRQAY